jgi:hypothetical protein
MRSLGADIRIVLTNPFLYSVGYNALGERLQYVGQREAEEGIEEEKQ